MQYKDQIIRGDSPAFRFLRAVEQEEIVSDPHNFVPLLEYLNNSVEGGLLIEIQDALESMQQWFVTTSQIDFEMVNDSQLNIIINKLIECRELRGALLNFLMVYVTLYPINIEPISNEKLFNIYINEFQFLTAILHCNLPGVICFLKNGMASILINEYYENESSEVQFQIIQVFKSLLDFPLNELPDVSQIELLYDFIKYQLESEPTLPILELCILCVKTRNKEIYDQQVFELIIDEKCSLETALLLIDLIQSIFSIKDIDDEFILIKWESFTKFFESEIFLISFSEMIYQIMSKCPLFTIIPETISMGLINASFDQTFNVKKSVIKAILMIIKSYNTKYVIKMISHGLLDFIISFFIPSQSLSYATEAFQYVLFIAQENKNDEGIVDYLLENGILESIDEMENECSDNDKMRFEGIRREIHRIMEKEGL